MRFIAKSVQVVFLVALYPALTGCGYLFGDEGVFRDTSEDYKRAPELPVVTVPEDGQSKDLQELYLVPEVQESLVMAGDFEVPRPQPLATGAADELVRIQKLGEESWALVSAAPGQVWPQVRAFLSAAGISVARVDARLGIIDTNWLDLQNESINARFQFRIEQGVQRGSSELHVLQQNQAGDINDWPAKSDNPEQEAEMLRAVAQYIANSSDSAPVSMIADQAISAGGKISMQESPEGYTYIRVTLPYERAWASLGRALEKSGFEITDRDRSSGKYYTRLVGQQSEEDDGWFHWLFDDEDEAMQGREFMVTLAEETGETVIVRMAPQDGSTLEKREEQALLSLIKGNIQ